MQQELVFQKTIQRASNLLITGQTDTPLYQQLYRLLSELVPIQTQYQTNQESVMSGSQVHILRSQILTYKHLIRNISPLDNLSRLDCSQWSVEKDRLSQKALTYFRQRQEKDNQIKNFISRKFKVVQSLQDRQFIQKVDYFINKRKQQINSLLSTQTLSKSARTRMALQLKFLNVKDIYFKVREKIIQGLMKQRRNNRIFQRQLLDRNFFRRQRPQSKQNAHLNRNQVTQLQGDRRRRMKHKGFMQQMLIHQNQFFQYHKRKNKNIKKVMLLAKQSFEAIKKKRQSQQAQKLRVQLIKSNKWQQYIKHLQLTKNSRIIDLLKQTDKFLRQLGAKIKIQKGQAPTKQDEQIQQNNDDILKNILHSNKIYYQLNHNIIQPIQNQPNNIQKNCSLNKYQIKGLQWLVSLYNNNLNGILADQMGLGKTIQTISLFCYLIQHKKNYGPFLIVVPLSTMSNWILEFDKWAPIIKKIAYKGSPATRKQLAKTLRTTKWNVCITTYQYILKDRLVLNKYQWKYIVVDQGHRMKNSKAKFSQVLGQQYISDHRLLLTGTPLQNNLAQLWALLNFLLPRVFQSCEDFQKWFYLPISKQMRGQNVGLSQQQQLLIINRLHQVLRPFLLRRIKKQVQAQLPDKKQFIVKVQLSAWQKIVQKSIQQKGIAQFDSQSGKFCYKKAVINLVMQLRKICNHPYLFLGNYQDLCYDDMIFRSSGKFQLLDRIIPKLIKFRHRILIFSQMTNLMDILQVYLNYKGIKHLRLDGSTKADDRAQRMKLFNKQDSQYDIFLLSTRAGGLGLNLQTADTVVIFDSDWNPQMDKQAKDRAHRIGQKNQVRVLRLITNTKIEQMILKRAAYKNNLHDLYINAGMYNQRSTQNQQKQMLQDLLKNKKTQDGMDSQIPDDQQINTYIMRDQNQFNQFQKMDQERYQRQAKIYKYFVDPRKSQSFFNYRLLNQDQVPEWIKQKPKQAQKDQPTGRGHRKKKQVNYGGDDLSDQLLRKQLMQDFGELQEQPQKLQFGEEQS